MKKMSITCPSITLAPPVTFMYLYEKVEEMGLDVFLKKSQRVRDGYLKKTPSDEITCYFLFMHYKEFRECFTLEAILESFKRLPDSDLFTWCKFIPMQDFTILIHPTFFMEKWNTMSPRLQFQEYYESPELVFGLVDQGLVTYQEIYNPFREYKADLLSQLYSRHESFSILFQPFKDVVFDTMVYIPDELIDLILSYLFVPAPKV